MRLVLKPQNKLDTYDQIIVCFMFFLNLLTLTISSCFSDKAPFNRIYNGRKLEEAEFLSTQTQVEKLKPKGQGRFTQSVAKLLDDVWSAEKWVQIQMTLNTQQVQKYMVEAVNNV